MTEQELAKMLRGNPDLRVDGHGEVSQNINFPMPKTKLSEHEFQTALIAECDRRALTNPLWGMILAIPNGQFRKGQRMEPGLRPGVPDLLLPLMRHGYGALFLEIKVSPNKPSEAQRDWLRILQEHGYFCKVIWDSVDEAIQLIDWYIEGR